MPTPERINLIQSPTPLHRLHFLSEELGIDLWIKRDDLTGFAGGGNKGRKLEYLLADTLSRRADTVVACGAAQSNFIRQLAAACSLYKIRCEAVVMDVPYDAAVDKPIQQGLLPTNGNIALDNLFGVHLHHVEDDDWQVLYDRAESEARYLESQGHSVYRIPVGGSSALGGYAFFEAAQEIARQAPAFDFIVTATSSGSTQAGLSYGLRGSKTKLIGIGADPEPDLIEDVLRVSVGLSELLQTDMLKESDFDVRLDWAGEAYGVPSAEGNSAIQHVAQNEGILLDPIYTGKAFAGLLDLAHQGHLHGRVLFWHTGGVPALFAMREPW